MHIPKIKIFLASFFETLQRYCKHVRVIWAWLSNPSKLIVLTCRKLWSLMFISKQKMNFITHFFLEILHSYLEYFGHDKSHPSNHQILMVSTCRKLYLHQKSTSSLIYFKEYCKDLAKLVILGTLAMTGPTTLNWLHQIVESVMLICLQKSTSSLPSFLRYCKDFAKCYIKYFGHGCMWPTKMISACRKLMFISC